MNARATHFVRFKSIGDQSYWNAVRVFGAPDFLHRVWDHRAQREIAAEDLVVFAKGPFDQPMVDFNYDDSAYQ